MGVAAAGGSAGGLSQADSRTVSKSSRNFFVICIINRFEKEE
jgi:hypothetical protein